MRPSRPCKQKGDFAPTAATLYIHVPFCLAKCGYCDFYSVPVHSADPARCIHAMGAELRACEGGLVRPVESIFVGGGTPTAVGPDLLRRLLAEVTRFADGRTEFTVEANPCTVGSAVAGVLSDSGVNRVSVGVQSFQAEELALLGRRHTPSQAAEAVATLRSAGIDNIGVDLIYGVPNQSLGSWQDSLRRAIELGARHLSCYALSFEQDTPLERRLAAGEVGQMDEQLQKDCYYAAIDLAEAAGLEHYELSNFAQPGRRCRHNLTYWRNEPYLGIGPAAASYLAGTRRTNRPDLAAYVEAIESGLAAPATSEKLEGRSAMAETIMLGLRLTDGLDRAAFARRHGQDAAEAFGRTVRRYAELGALRVAPSHIRLDRGTLFAADTVLADFLAEA